MIALLVVVVPVSMAALPPLLALAPLPPFVPSLVVVELLVVVAVLLLVLLLLVFVSLLALHVVALCNNLHLLFVGLELPNVLVHETVFDLVYVLILVLGSDLELSFVAAFSDRHFVFAPLYFLTCIDVLLSVFVSTYCSPHFRLHTNR